MSSPAGSRLRCSGIGARQSGSYSQESLQLHELQRRPMESDYRPKPPPRRSVALAHWQGPAHRYPQTLCLILEPGPLPRPQYPSDRLQRPSLWTRGDDRSRAREPFLLQYPYLLLKMIQLSCILLHLRVFVRHKRRYGDPGFLNERFGLKSGLRGCCTSLVRGSRSSERCGNYHPK